MATYNIEIREFNGTSYDVLYPKTTINNVDGLSTKISQLDTMSSDITTIKKNISALDANKQNKLKFDTTPTANSNNPVTSNGIKTAIGTQNWPITRLADDTINKWSTIPQGTYWYSNNGNFNPPTTQAYGFLQHSVNGIDVNQIFYSQPQGEMYRRSGSTSGNFSEWKKIAIGNFLPLSGGTLTGNLNIRRSGEAVYNARNNNLTLGTVPANDERVGGIFLRDKNDQPAGFLESWIVANGRSRLTIASMNKVNNTSVYNILDMAVGEDGSKFVAVSDPGAWRSAIGAVSSTQLDAKVSKSGDTMTGALNLANSTWNNVGDDCAFGDSNVSGCVSFKGLNDYTGLNFIQYNGTSAGKLTWDGTSFNLDKPLKLNGGTLQVAYGGTGAYTAAGALQNLGVRISNVAISEGSTLASGSIYIYYE